MPLTQALVGIQTEHLDHGPANAIAFHRGNVVVAVMHDVLTNAEKVSGQNGCHGDISESRRLFRQEMEADLRGAGERLNGRKVIAFLGANHPEPDVAAETFHSRRAGLSAPLAPAALWQVACAQTRSRPVACAFLVKDGCAQGSASGRLVRSSLRARMPERAHRPIRRPPIPPQG